MIEDIRSMLTLHYAPNSCARASHIALEEAGASYLTVRLDLKANQQRSEAYLSINPKGRVPTLMTNKGPLTETPAILAFIAQSFPEARLAPVGDPFAFAQVQAFNSYLSSTVHVAHAHRVRGSRWADEPEALLAMQKKVPVTMAECMSLIETTMFSGPWVMGQGYTICDPYLFTLCGWLEADGVALARFPRLADHYGRMLERPAVKTVLAEEAQ